jgi:hypothetical protein
MKIEEGKMYVRRDGNITGEMRAYPDDGGYHFANPMGGIYTNKGCYWNTEGWGSPLDLIKEYKPKMKDTVKVKKQFLLDGHKEACQSWKERIEKEAPELFGKPELVKGEWYKNELDTVFFFNGKTNGVNPCGFGFSGGSDWTEETDFGWFNEGIVPASEQEVTEVLIKEAKKRGYMEAFSIKDLSSFGGIIEVGCEKTFKFYASEDLWLNNANENVLIFREGKWAEIVEEKKPELVKGEWYKTLLGNGDISILFNFQKEDSRGILCGYGLNVFADKWFDSVAWTSKEDSKLTKVTKEEISSALIAEAKRRGFKEGVIVKTFIEMLGDYTLNGNYFSVERECYNGGDDFGLRFGGACIYANGKWASIIPAKDKNDSLKASVKALEEQLKELKRQIG